ncbi:hypothetical protein [Sagittula salina]|uniref:Uncharacterized protein n=1 Tax=Sagittula salina TaxID=2820268 RepID=A0A940S1H5_9RHOB|nr:hypothetical protein [Sagittula salina]MBP0484158.1 hypothetical protein [Sagittula salina]
MDSDRTAQFIYNKGGCADDALAEGVPADRLWQSLAAVQASHMHPVSNAIWNTARGNLPARVMLRGFFARC